MADVRCPMCGKPNPADAEICQHCKARLKPLDRTAGSDSKTQPAASPQKGDEATEWPRGLIEPSSAPEGSSPTEANPPAEDSLDWLARIRQRSQEEQDDLSKIGPKPQIEGQNAAGNDWQNDSAAPETSSPGSGSDVSAWLASLRESDETPSAAPTPVPSDRSSADKQPPAASSPDKAENDDDEWLRSLTSRIQISKSLEDQLSQAGKNQPENISQQPSDSAAAAEDLPDWLRDLEPLQAPGENEPPAAAAATGTTPEWLNESKSASAEPAQPESLPDWLKALQSSDESPAEPVSLPAAAQDLPGFQQEPQNLAAPEPVNPEPGPSEAANFTDLMNDFQNAQSAAAADAVEPVAQADATPDWMRDFQPETPTAETNPPASGTDEPSALPAEDLPDWMREIEAEAPTAAVEPPSAQTGVELPDWLNDFNAPAVEASSAVMPSAAVEPTAEDSSSTEWLSDFGAPTAEPAATPTAADVPDWLRDFNQTGAQAEIPDEGPAEEAAAVPAQVPDWLRDFQGIPSAETDGLPPGETNIQTPGVTQVPGLPADIPAQEPPDWLKEFEAAPADTPANDWFSNLNEIPGAAAAEGISTSDALPAEEIPEWLKPAAAAESPTRMTEPTPGQGPIFGEEDLPDWMKSGQPIESGSAVTFEAADNRGAMGSIPAFDSRETNETAQGLSMERQKGEPTREENEPETLEPAQMPTWLQAMRPVESAVTPAAPVFDEQRIERSGPLAGLVGVLPGEELVANYRKPPVYSNKLEVNEKQHLNSVLLERILQDESQAQPVPAGQAQSSQMISRILVAIILLILAIIPGLTGFKLTVPAGLPAMQAGLGAMYKSINDLQPGAYVLFAADYEAGLNGEMKSAADAVLRHLQQRQPRVILASTIPAGPLLGDQLLKDAKIKPVANLGYLAGGSTTLKRLSARASVDLPDPLQQVVPYPTRHGWKDEAMQGIKDLNSFQRIIVLTDSVENARAWVEQVQPALGPQTQLIMISSAQVAPLVRAYLDSNQVQGLVSGLLGGAAYEQLMRQPGPAAAAWTAYQLTLAAVILLIAAGALMAGITNLVRRSKSQRKA